MTDKSGVSGGVLEKIRSVRVSENADNEDQGRDEGGIEEI